MRCRVSAVMAVVVLMLAVPALAHHSFASFFDMNQTIAITGVVKSTKIVNPHGEMVVEVTEPTGQKSLWSVIARGPANATRRAGWKSNLLVGETVTVEGHPPLHKKDAKAMAAGKVTLSDGKVMWLGGGGGVPGQ